MADMLYPPSPLLEEGKTEELTANRTGFDCAENDMVNYA